MFNRIIMMSIAVILLVSCSSDKSFILRGVPSYMEAITGQRCLFLVELAEDDGSGAVEISASVEDADVIVEFSPLRGDGVAEVTIIPDSSALQDTLWGDTITGWIKGERGTYRDSFEISIHVIPWEDGLTEYASGVRDSFVRRLTRDYPALFIDNTTEWTPTIVRPRILVVSHYLFLSEEWEMWVGWHVTIYPHDWARVYLRERGEEMTPSEAFEISSQTEWGDVYEITPPDSIYR